MSLTLKLLDIDITNRVIEWGQVEEIKEVLLAEAQLVSGETSLALENTDRCFSPENFNSILKGVPWTNSIVKIRENETDIFLGYLKDIQPDDAQGIATIVLENLFSKPAETTAVVSGSLVNPGSALYAILKSVGLEEYLDKASFYGAGAQAQVAGATISFTYTQADGVSALAAVNDISKLCSIAVLTRGSKIFAKAFRTYQGSESELKEEITTSTARGFGKITNDQESYSNNIILKYGDNLTYSQEDSESQRVYDVVRTTNLTATNSDKLTVPDLVSAAFFVGQYLSRAKDRRILLPITLGPKHTEVQVGNRYPVTYAAEGFSRKAFEIIEVHRQLGEDATEVLAASL